METWDCPSSYGIKHAAIRGPVKGEVYTIRDIGYLNPNESSALCMRLVEIHNPVVRWIAGVDAGGDVLDLPVRDGERLTEGRFALFSGEPETPTAAISRETVSTRSVPGIVVELDYEELTLAQLRARLTSLRIGDLEALLAYEESTKARAPFQTLLANRITRASAK